MNRKPSFGAACAAVLSASACDGSCVRGEEPEFDCAAQAEAFEASYADDGKLLPEIPDRQSFPMAMVLSEDGINRLITGVVGGKVPFASTVDLGPVGLQFTPSAEPVIEIAKVPNCARCVKFKVDFYFTLIDNQGEPSGSGIGAAEASFPLSLVQNDDGSSSLVADYSKATIRDMPFTTMGFVSGDYPGIEGAIEVLATEAIRTQYGTQELLRFQPWTIGNGDVKLAAREFAIYPESKVLALGLQTNLDIPENVSVAVGRELPMGVPMQVQMHPGLLYEMAQRMIVEGAIARTYNDQGQPDPGGLYGMTLEGMSPSDIPGSDLLDVAFRVWRTEEGYCGYADARTELRLGVSPTDDSITVTPTDTLKVTGGAGVGELAATDEELVEKNKKLVDTFKKDLSEQVGITINYNEVGVEGTRILFDTEAVLVKQDSIDIIIDFVVVAAEDP
jgi:hypothetical protein